MIDVLTLVLLALAVARGTFLMVFDDITAFIRDAVLAKWGPDHLLTKGVNCPWCWSVWISAGMTLATFAFTNPTAHPWQVFLTFLAVAFVGGFLAERASR